MSEALHTALAEARAVADDIVIAGYIKGNPAIELAQDFPEVALVLGSWVPVGSNGLLNRGGAPILLGGERGQYVFWAELADARAKTGGRIWLGGDVPDHPDLAAVVARHDAEASALGPSQKRRIQTLFRESGRAPSRACKSCHAAEYEAWKNSKHSHAMRSLQLKESARNPNCLTCHYQDLAVEGTDASGVGCSACHESTMDHVERMRAGHAVSSARIETQPTATCSRCHDEANSPNFDFKSYWREIAHGARRSCT